MIALGRPDSRGAPRAVCSSVAAWASPRADGLLDRNQDGSVVDDALGLAKNLFGPKA